MIKKRNTLFVGKFHEHFSALESTNEYAAKRLAEGRPAEGTVVTTFDQRAGRGQRGNTWMSEPGKNIAFSLILYPGFLLAERTFLLNQMASLAVRDLLQPLLEPEVQVKWPNDVLVDQRKVAGILIQNTLGGRVISSSIVGIGLNVNQVHFPAHLPQAGSLRAFSDKNYDLPELVADLCHHLEQRYLQLRQGRYAQMDDAYSRSMYGRGAWLTFERPGGALFSAQLLGTDHRGCLRLRHADGREEHFQVKNVRLATQSEQL